MKDTKSRLLRITVAVCFILAALTWAATAQTNVYKTSVTLGWTQADTNITGFYLYKGGASGVYTNRVEVPYTNSYTNIAVASDLLVGSTYFFAVTAKNTTVESLFSNEVAYTANIVVLPPPVVPPTATIILQGSILVATSPNGPWVALTNFVPVVTTNNGVTKFYNAVVGVR